MKINLANVVSYLTKKIGMELANSNYCQRGYNRNKHNANGAWQLDKSKVDIAEHGG